MFGVSTLCLHKEPLTTALEKISSLSDHIEVLDEGLHYLASAEPLLSYTSIYSLHAPSRGTNIASQLEPIRRASVEVMGQCMSVAAEVNAGIVIHPGYFAWEPERDTAVRQLGVSLGELSHLSEEYSVPFYVENMGNWDYFLLKTPAELPLIGTTPFALDVGHANQNHCLVDFLSHPAAHYHLHDNNGREDSHFAVGEGTIDFAPVMKAVQKNNIIPIIEVATLEGVQKSIRALRMIRSG